MSFFTRENFTLPNEIFQTGVETVTNGNGIAYQDGDYGYIKTFADADVAMFTCDEGLAIEDFANKHIKITVSYELTSLTASDLLYTFCLIYDSDQPEADQGSATMSFRCLIVNNAGTYEERWWYKYGGDWYYYKGTTDEWTAVNTDRTRTISLATNYTLEITIDPAKGLVSFDNDTQSTTTPYKPDGDLNDRWWFIGDQATTNYIGQLKLYYVYVEDVTVRKSIILKNSLTKAYQKSPFSTLINSLTTRHRDSFTLKNYILDHEPFQTTFKLLNNIGVTGQLIFLDGSWVTTNIWGKQLDNVATVEIDGLDVSSKINDWSIDYDDQTICKTISLTTKDRGFAESIKLRKYNDTGYKDPRIEVIDHEGYSLGEFLLENKSEDVASKSYSCTLSGRSMTALLDIPFSAKLDTLYDEKTSKYAVVSDLVTGEALSLSWGIPDAVLPVGALTCDDEPPISVIMKVVQAGGGVVHTDRQDYVVCDYKAYETSGKTPVMSISSGDIVRVSRKTTVPDGENSVEVSGYEDLSATEGWAKIVLTSSKSRLRSNGYDSCTLTAKCWHEDLSIPDVELQEEEEQTPARNDHYEISVSYMIDTTRGVVEIKKKSDSSVVAGPYEILDDGYTIRTLTAMADTTYQITYWGGETVNFGVDNYADIAPTEVLIRNGVATATLRASAGGGGWATCTADFLDAQTAELQIQIADPRVGSIDVSANPSSIVANGTSTVTIKVSDSEGYPAQNGLAIDLKVEDQYAQADYTGTITPSTTYTTTETVVEGTGDDPVWSTSEIEVTTANPITTLTSIYRVEGGEAYSDVNYATSATVTGNSIELATPLPGPNTPLIVTYTASGIATATFAYPTATLEIPDAGRFNYVFATSGGEEGMCRIEIDGPDNTGGSPSSGGTGGNKAYDIEFKGSERPNRADGLLIKQKRITWVSGYEPKIIGTKVVTMDGGTLVGVTTEVLRTSARNYTVITCTIQAVENYSLRDYEDSVGNIHGERKVVAKKTANGYNAGDPIPNANVYIDWNGDGDYVDDEDETTTTNNAGLFYFTKGVKGEEHKLKITHADFNDLNSTIKIPGTVYEANENVTTWSTVTYDVLVSIWNEKVD